jgi:exonuclease SbcC
MLIVKAETELEQRRRELESQGERAASASMECETLRVRLAEEKSQLEKLATRLANLSEREQAWQEARSRLQQVEYERKLSQQELIQLQSQAGEMERRAIEREQIQESHRAASTAVEAALKGLSELTSQQQTLSEKLTERAGLRTEQDRLQQEAEAKKDQIDRLQGEQGQDCPLCGQPLTADHRDTVLRQYQTDLEEFRSRFRSNRAQLPGLEEEIKALKKAVERQPVLEKERDSRRATVVRAEARLHDIDLSLAAWREGSSIARIAEIESLLADEAEARELQQRLADLKSAADESKRLDQEQRRLETQIAREEARVEELDRLGRQWEETGRPAWEEAKRQLAERAFARDERVALARIEVRLDEIGYDEGAHKASSAQRDMLAEAPREHQQLQQAEAAVKPLAEMIDDLQQQRERAIGRLVDLRARCAETTRLLRELEAGVEDLRGAEIELQRLREQTAAAIRVTAGARQKVDVLRVRREDKEKLTATRNAVAHRVSLLRQLEEACGRKGVQAMLIEAALPEIEDYANDLLSGLTGGDMRIRFITQRAHKKVDAQIETLDIEISDSTGTRPYENYSGGEQFRVNFAVRLALSQVLARRAGARLRTLVIDEGFGSQDPEGRQKLVEAINAVQDKFACILVITHIDELRDKFPARIDVEKTTVGSRISVVTL